MTSFNFIKADNAVMAVSAASVTGKTFQLKDLAGTEISSTHKGFFWKVVALDYKAVQNIKEAGHVGTNIVDPITTTKTFEGTIELTLISASADITLAGTSTTLHAVDPKSIYQQVIAGNGETYTLTLYVGCTLKSAAANGTEDYADPDTATMTFTLNEVIFTQAPLPAKAGDVITMTCPIRFKSSTLV